MPLPLNPGQAVVWWLALDGVGEPCWPRWAALLDEEETARAGRFHFAADRQQFIAAHALARTMLATFGSRPPAAWRFAPGPKGKPAPMPPEGHPPLSFNLSHTRGLVACVVARGLDAGVDVEATDRQRLDLAIAEAYFAPSEVALVRAAGAGAGRDLFFRFWTLKESYIKATGEGLSRPLDSFAFTLDPIRLRTDPPRPGPWRFDQLRPTERHLMAVALGGREAAELSIREVRPEDF